MTGFSLPTSTTFLKQNRHDVYFEFYSVQRDNPSPLKRTLVSILKQPLGSAGLAGDK